MPSSLLGNNECVISHVTSHVILLGNNECVISHVTSHVILLGNNECVISHVTSHVILSLCLVKKRLFVCLKVSKIC